MMMASDGVVHFLFSTLSMSKKKPEGVDGLSGGPYAPVLVSCTWSKETPTPGIIPLRGASNTLISTIFCYDSHFTPCRLSDTIRQC